MEDAYGLPSSGFILAVRATEHTRAPLKISGGPDAPHALFVLLARAAFCAAVLSTGTAPGCMTTFEARRTKASVADIRARLDALESVDGEHAKQNP